MLRWFRDLLAVMQAMVVAVVSVEKVVARGLEDLAADNRLLGRVEELELSRGIWEAGIEADVLKAQGKLQAANNAEARARTMGRHAERFLMDGDPEGQEGSEAVRAGDDAPGAAEGVYPLPVGLETDPKQIALRHKFF